MRTLRLLLCAACLCSAGVFVKSAMTQERVRDEEPLREAPRRDLFEDPDRVTPRPNANTLTPLPDAAFSAPMRPRTVRHTVTRTLMEPIPPEELKAMQKLQAAIQQLKTGKENAARKAATETIQQQLATQFEADLKQREKELAEVEQRVKSLREQLDKRKAAQADIINLRLQTLINDANGLGFPDTGFASGQPTVHDRAQAPLYQPGRTDETDAPSYDPGQKDSDVFERDAFPESLQPVIPRSKPPLE